jgi:serine/threonine protein kinase
MTILLSLVYKVTGWPSSVDHAPPVPTELQLFCRTRTTVSAPDDDHVYRLLVAAWLYMHLHTPHVFTTLDSLVVCFGHDPGTCHRTVYDVGQAMFGRFWFGEHAPWTILSLLQRGNSSILWAYHPVQRAPDPNPPLPPTTTPATSTGLDSSDRTMYDGSTSCLWIIKQHLLVSGEYEVQHYMWKEVVAIQRFQAYRWCPRLYGISLDHDTLSIAMEYIPLSWTEIFPPYRRTTIELVRRTLHDLLQGLSDIHSAGIAHRDIKPENIRFRADGTLVIMDYDSSETVDTPFRSAVFGTPAYRDPYLPLITEGPYLSDDAYDYRATDMFAAGYVFLIMVVAAMGDDALSVETVVQHLLASTPPPVSPLEGRHQPRLPESLRDYLGPSGECLLRRLICSHPSDRYTATQSLTSAFLTP